MKDGISNGLSEIKNPIIYEINTAVWLRELSKNYRDKITLENIPGRELDTIAKLGFDMVWLMGVWKRSTSGINIAKEHSGIMNELREALPDMQKEDLAGSPYCVKDYQVDNQFGGSKGLAAIRKALADRGIGLLLDFVPNHVAPDHPWTKTHPQYFITGTKEELAAQPDDFFQVGENIFAKARDPFYPPWPDVMQLNIFNEGLREAMLNTLLKIAGKCDGIRCDMAMLIMNDIFQNTWKDKAGPFPGKDFWSYAIPAVKSKYPGFVFIAESYWDTEISLVEQGFDYCYDKKYYDYLKEGAEIAGRHLDGMAPVQEKLLRFLENHDEARAAQLFNDQRHMAIAMASLTLPGARLLHEGQMEGRKVKVPVFLSRRQDETENRNLSQFYRNLLKILQFDAVRSGKWSMCKVSGWPDNQSCRNILAWEWVSQSESLIVVINLSNSPAQGLIKPDYEYLPGRTYQLFEVISGELYRRDGEEMNGQGLYVVLNDWGMHAFHIEL